MQISLSYQIWSGPAVRMQDIMCYVFSHSVKYHSFIFHSEFIRSIERNRCKWIKLPFFDLSCFKGSRLDDLSQAEATSLAVFLDITGDVADIPLVLLRNVARFCRSGGLLAMTTAFKLSAQLLPSNIAHGLVSVLCNLKLWLNPRAISQLFGPVRGAALQYMCGLGDQGWVATMIIWIHNGLLTIFL